MTNDNHKNTWQNYDKKRRKKLGEGGRARIEREREAKGRGRGRREKERRERGKKGGAGLRLAKSVLNHASDDIKQSHRL